MNDLKAVAVSIPGLGLEIYVRPFGHSYVVTGDPGETLEKADIIAFYDDPDEAWRSAVDYLNYLTAADDGDSGGS